MKQTKTEELFQKLVLQAQMAADTTLAHSKRSAAFVRLSQTMFEIARPSFDGGKLSEALRGACIAEPDQGHSAVWGYDGLYVNGTFDLAKLSALYFVGTPKVIQGRRKK